MKQQGTKWTGTALDRPDAGFWSAIFKIEPAAIRTVAAVLVPLVVGQIAHQQAAGLFVGLGGLYAGITDRNGAGVKAQFVAGAGAALMSALAALAAPHIPLALATVFILALGCGMAGIYGPVAGQVTFVFLMVYAVMLGLPASPAVIPERTAEIFAGGLWGILLTILLRRFHREADQDSGNPDEPDPPASFSEALARLRSNLSLRSKDFQHALRLAIAVTAALAVFETLHMNHGYWLALSAIVILKREWDATKERAYQRIAGTIIGGLLGAFLAAFVHNLLVLDILLLLFSMLAYSNLSRHYGVFVFFLTPFIVLMINSVQPGQWDLGLIRIAYTVAGGVLALLLAALFRLEESAPDTR